MNKKIIIAAIVFVLILGFGVGGFFYLKYLKKSLANVGNKNLENISGMDKITESATKGVLPDLQTNPLENKPDINPVSKTNPYKNIKINPFE